MKTGVSPRQSVWADDGRSNDAAVVLLGGARGECLRHFLDNLGIVGEGSGCAMGQITQIDVHARIN